MDELETFENPTGFDIKTYVQDDLYIHTLYWLNDQTQRPVPLSTAAGSLEEVYLETEIDLIPLPPLPLPPKKDNPKIDPLEPPRPNPLLWNTGPRPQQNIGTDDPNRHKATEAKGDPSP